MSSGTDILALYREFTNALTEVLAENAVGPARRGRTRSRLGSGSGGLVHRSDRLKKRYPASPRKINIAWLTRAMSATSRCPMRDPNLLFGTVVILSTMSLEMVVSPFWSLG